MSLLFQRPVGHCHVLGSPCPIPTFRPPFLCPSRGYCVLQVSNRAHHGYLEKSHLSQSPFPTTCLLLLALQLGQHVVRLREELDREREERNYFQLERDKIHTFWEITRRQLEEKKAELRNKDREMEEAEERHQVEIKVGG